MNLTAIILAGGLSLRMGTDKALIPYRSKPLIRYSIDLALCFTETILISTNQDSLQDFGFPVIKDKYPLKAPLAGIHAGLLESKTEWNLVLTCDMPNVSILLIEYLISQVEEKTGLILPGHDGFVEPLCGLYHRSLINLIESNFGENKLSPLDLLMVSPHKIVQVQSVPGIEPSIVFKNVNAREDLFT
jgi:molybdenum cofactor guanylyltransferase